MTPKLLTDLLFALGMANSHGISYALIQVAYLLAAEFHRRRTQND